ncbi:MAG: flavodoxin [Acidimicrobiia bacterium]
MPRMLVVHHTPSPACHAMLEAVLDGARDPAIEGVDVVVRPALVAAAIEVLEADGYIVGGPVNLGYLAGAVKHFFDQIYYPCLEATRGRPWALYLHGQNDATGALRAAETIVTGLGWRAVTRPVVVLGEPSRADLDACRELGATVAATLAT